MREPPPCRVRPGGLQDERGRSEPILHGGLPQQDLDVPVQPPAQRLSGALRGAHHGAQLTRGADQRAHDD